MTSNQLAIDLQELLKEHQDKRVVVIGASCTGKTTLLQELPAAQDMDKLLFPLLTRAEAEYVCQTPWTEEIGKTMKRLARERISVQPGKPVFGTIVLDCDLIIYLSISDELLRERCNLRKVDFLDAKNMQTQIDAEVLASGLTRIHFIVG